mmetsp:Transcript_10827/g.17353  ORF Transcript_10827/g.17353 Transcript_10827/m.17353 type:complete len:132 (+) Transcript_10827:730-1125(+)
MRKNLNASTLAKTEALWNKEEEEEMERRPANVRDSRNNLPLRKKTKTEAAGKDDLDSHDSTNDSRSRKKQRRSTKQTAHDEDLSDDAEMSEQKRSRTLKEFQKQLRTAGVLDRLEKAAGQALPSLEGEDLF